MSGQSLEDFIYWFVPSGQEKHIGFRGFIPSISDQDMAEIAKGNIPPLLNRPWFREAIAAYFERNKDTP